MKLKKKVKLSKEVLQQAADDGLVPIRLMRVTKRGERGLVITVPTFWADSLGVGYHSDMLVLQRPNSNDIILRPIPMEGNK